MSKVMATWGGAPGNRHASRLRALRDSKLSIKDILYLRELHLETAAEGERLVVSHYAEEYGITKVSMRKIFYGETFGWITRENEKAVAKELKEYTKGKRNA